MQDLRLVAVESKTGKTLKTKAFWGIIFLNVFNSTAANLRSGILAALCFFFSMFLNQLKTWKTKTSWGINVFDVFNVSKAIKNILTIKNKNHFDSCF